MHPQLRHLASGEWDRLDAVLKDFEAALQGSPPPSLEEFLTRAPAVTPALLAELTHLDLEYRLKAGEPARVEDYLRRWPALAADPATVLDLLAAEHTLRRRREPALAVDEYARRFPQYAAELTARLPAATTDGRDLPVAALPDLPGYEILDVLGRGGMGVVYRARQQPLGRVVAVKMIRSGDHADPEHLARFLAEARVVSRLRHPHIVQIFEAGEHQGRPYFALEFVDGGSLDRHLAGTPQPPPQAAALVAALARAIDYAHGQGVVHRDLKPANILMAVEGGGWRVEGGRGVEGGGWRVEGNRQPSATLHPPPSTLHPKITDFGLAKLQDGDTGQTQSGAVLGTPSYMAPEQAAGDGARVGPAADVYALGAILYELLTGRPPFKGASPLETLEQVRGQEPVSPRRLQPRVPRDLETICLKCLEKEPARRYPSALELALDLEHFGRGEPIRARPVGVVVRTVKWARRRPTAAALAAVSVLAAAALVGGGLWYQARVRETEARARARALVEGLVVAETARVPDLLANLEGYHAWAEPYLRALAAESPAASKARLHAALGLLRDDPGQAEYLFGRLLDADAHEAAVICRALADAGHSPALVQRLWEVVSGPPPRPKTRLLPAACALALYDPENRHWQTTAGPVAEQLVAVSPVHLGAWMEDLRPVRGHLLAPLATVFRDRNPERAAERALATSVLADYAADRPDVLADLLQDADEKQFALLFPKAEALSPAVSTQLRRTVQADLASEPAEERKEWLARRQANAAVGLLRLGRATEVWPLLRHGPDPRVRSHLVHALSPKGANVRALVAQLERAPDVSVRRALILSLGEFGDEAYPADERRQLVPTLLTHYRQDPDAGLHAAVRWLLRNWGEAPATHGIDQELAVARAGGKPAAGAVARPSPSWYVNGQAQTMVVLPGPAEFVMGSPLTEKDRTSDEVPHRRRIGRTFALGADLVTVEQYRRFNPSFGGDRMRRCPEPDCPVLGILWYDAAAYCNWLSRQEGIPEDQWCYVPRAGGTYEEGMRLADGYLARTGYRLPTEAEWEYACRAGAVTSRSYGAADALLGKYAWYAVNANDRTWPVGSLKPNDWGLFDMHGGLWVWCQDRYRAYGPPGPDGVVADVEDALALDNKAPRVLRGGSYANDAANIRSANRYWVAPTNLNNSVGLRVARTLR